MISKDGQKTDIYEYAQAVNLEIQTFANAFLNFEWQGTTNYLNEEGAGILRSTWSTIRRFSQND